VGPCLEVFAAIDESKVNLHDLAAK
jgi:hypothetical protein